MMSAAAAKPATIQAFLTDAPDEPDSAGETAGTVLPPVACGGKAVEGRGWVGVANETVPGCALAPSVLACAAWTPVAITINARSNRPANSPSRLCDLICMISPLDARAAVTAESASR